VAVALLQSGAIMNEFAYSPCSPQRTGFDLTAIMDQLMLEHVVAANYFIVDQDPSLAAEFCGRKTGPL
jgi:hypothetical protein